MFTYKTTNDRIINIFKNNITDLNNYHITLTNYELNKIELKAGRFNLIINIKEEEENISLLFDINSNINSPLFKIDSPAVKNHIDTIINFIDSQLNENEKTEDSKSRVLKIKIAKQKQKNIQKYSIIGFLVLMGSCFVVTVSSYGFNGHTYCDGFSKSTSDMCLEFNNGVVKKYFKNPYGGVWELSKTSNYVVKEKEVTYKGEKHDIISVNSNVYNDRYIILGKPAVTNIAAITIDGRYSRTFYKQ